MKATPVTDDTVKIIQTIINELNSIIDYENYSFVDFESMLSDLKEYDSKIHAISLDNVKKEFWENCEDYEKIPALKKVFEVKFKNLFKWRFKDLDNCFENWKCLKLEIDIFISNYESEMQSVVPANIKTQIRTLYRDLNRRISMLKDDIREILNEFGEMTPDHLQIREMTSYVGSEFRIAKNRKTDFIKIISAMYDNRMFETEDGYLASSKQELMNEFGRIVNEDLSNYSVLLSKSKNPDKDIFLKPFKDIEKKAEEYYDKES